MIEEHWARIENFPAYLISDYGNIFNIYTDHMMRTSYNQYGHMKISLVDHNGQRHDRSVRRLVANAFVERPNSLCTEVAVLDGDFTNMTADNLVWRPKWFVWKYTHQLQEAHPIHYYNLVVRNLTRGFIYTSVIEAGMTEGLLFDDIWRSTYSGAEIFPYADIFQVE